jgi:hypothetical protein
VCAASDSYGEVSGDFLAANGFSSSVAHGEMVIFRIIVVGRRGGVVDLGLLVVVGVRVGDGSGA